MIKTLIIIGFIYLVIMFIGLFSWAINRVSKDSPPMTVREKRFLIITWVGALLLGALLVVIIQWLFKEKSHWGIVIICAITGTYSGLMSRHQQKLRQEEIRRFAETSTTL